MKPLIEKVNELLMIYESYKSKSQNPSSFMEIIDRYQNYLKPTVSAIGYILNYFGHPLLGSTIGFVGREVINFLAERAKSKSKYERELLEQIKTLQNEIERAKSRMKLSIVAMQLTTVALYSFW